MEVRGQLAGVRTLFLQRESQELNSGRQALEQTPLPAEPSHWLLWWMLDFGSVVVGSCSSFCQGNGFQWFEDQ